MISHSKQSPFAFYILLPQVLQNLLFSGKSAPQAGQFTERLPSTEVPQILQKREPAASVAPQLLHCTEAVSTFFGDFDLLTVPMLN